MVKQYEVYLVSLDPTVGHEVKKTRPAVIISPDEMNDVIGTVLIAPMTTVSRPYPSRAAVKFAGTNGQVMLDQIRCVDKKRLVQKLGRIRPVEIRKVKEIIHEMLVQ